MNDTTTYLLTTRPRKQSSVTTTLEKYYGDLIKEMAVSPADTCALVRFETTHELPLDAFHRIVEVENVFEETAYIRAVSRTSIERHCEGIVSQLSNEARMTVEIVRSNDCGYTAAEIERWIEDLLTSKERDCLGSDELTHQLHIALADDWGSLVFESLI